jgi:hypothetical protein
MTALEQIIPAPGLLEINGVDLALPIEQAWEIVRHGDLARSRLVHALFAIRTLPDHLRDQHEPLRLRIDDLVSSAERPGFQLLVDDPPHELVVGAIGKVWKPEIEFLHAPTADAFAAFNEPGFVKVAWALRLRPLGEHATRVAFELRVAATDDAAWKKFRAYWRIIGVASHFIRRSLLSALAKEHGTPASKENERPLPGDELLPDAVAQVTHGVTLNAKPEAIWPWLVQMGCQRAGFYSIDALDNGGQRSAREIHPELQDIHVGDVLPATPDGPSGFEVLRLEQSRVLVLGGLYDAAAEQQLRFAAPRPDAFWHATWAFVLEPIGEGRTRLSVRARVAYPESGKLHAAWTRFAHYLMQTAQLRHLAARIEGRMPADDWRDVSAGVGGAAIMVAAMLTPFLRQARSHWGLDAATAERSYPGDELIGEPRWSWTHGIEIDAPAAEVWPWIAQIGADKAGFYSYQWLENIAGCDLRNAEAVHPEWAVRQDGTLRLHPEWALRIVSLKKGEHFVAHAPADPAARAAGESWAEASWLFYLEPLGAARCRFISRYRVDCSDDIATRIKLGPTFIEPIGFAMDRKMLMGVKERAERAQQQSA